LFTVLTSALLGCLLLLAGVSKLGDRESRLVTIQGYRLLPDAGERLVAHVLPHTEIVLGALLLIGLGAPVVPAAAMVLFLVFLVALSINLARGRRELDCGCFALFRAEGRAPRISWAHAGRAALLAALAGSLLLPPGGYGIGATPVGEYLLGLALAALLVAAGFATAAVRAVVRPGRRSVDDHLSAARREVRASLRATPLLPDLLEERNRP
jgi:Methylamine utilisation protein MauE